MPFPLERKYIDALEEDLGLSFPEIFKQKMMAENGGGFFTDDDDWTLHPILDKSDNKRIARTCNHIGLETRKAREWNNFPTNAVSIGTNGKGDQLVLLSGPTSGNSLLDEVYIWKHETGNTTKIAANILELMQ